MSHRVQFSLSDISTRLIRHGTIRSRYDTIHMVDLAIRLCDMSDKTGLADYKKVKIFTQNVIKTPFKPAEGV